MSNYPSLVEVALTDTFDSWRGKTNVAIQHTDRVATVIGEVTPEAVSLLQHADAIVREEIAQAGLEREIWQAFAVLADIRSVGVMGDERTYARPIIIRAVTSEDAMTADWARLPYDILENMSSRIINEVEGVNRVVYDITSKPPGTIEWE